MREHDYLLDSSKVCLKNVEMTAMGYNAGINVLSTIGHHCDINDDSSVYRRRKPEFRQISKMKIFSEFANPKRPFTTLYV